MKNIADTNIVISTRKIRNDFLEELGRMNQIK